MATNQDKFALVTGASRGIGRATAKALAASGYKVIAHYGASSKDADSLLAEIRRCGGSAVALGVDLAAPTGALELAKKVAEMTAARPLDVLVANAGVTKSVRIEDTTVEDFDRLFAVNVRAPFFLLKELLPQLRDGASVVFVSSLGADHVVGTLAAYSSTKGAIDTLVRHAAASAGARGIRINAVAPGVIETDMSSFAKTDSGRAFTLDMQALKRIGQPDDDGGSRL